MYSHPNHKRQSETDMNQAKYQYQVTKLCEYHLEKDSFEEILYASFLEDINPDYILILTLNRATRTSRISIGKLMKRKEKIRRDFFGPEEHLTKPVKESFYESEHNEEK